MKYVKEGENHCGTEAGTKPCRECLFNKGKSVRAGMKFVKCTYVKKNRSMKKVCQLAIVLSEKMDKFDLYQIDYTVAKFIQKGDYITIKDVKGEQRPVAVTSKEWNLDTMQLNFYGQYLDNE